MRRLRSSCLALACCALACRAFSPPADSVLLPIADRPWAPEAPPEGWCGEASIQMAALHYGAWLPQRRIHQLGNPKHVDLWEDELPVALEAVGLKFDAWGAREGSDGAFLEWTLAQLRGGRPVILGIKLLPDRHPEQEVDHLVLAVGFGPTALTLNTNLAQGQQQVPYAALLGREGIALRAPEGRHFGWAVRGFDAQTRLSLRVLQETPQEVTLQPVPAARALRRQELDGTVTRLTLDGGAFTAAAELAARFAPAD